MVNPYSLNVQQVLILEVSGNFNEHSSMGWSVEISTINDFQTIFQAGQVGWPVASPLGMLVS